MTFVWNKSIVIGICSSTTSTICCSSFRFRFCRRLLRTFLAIAVAFFLTTIIVNMVPAATDTNNAAVLSPFIGLIAAPPPPPPLYHQDINSQNLSSSGGGGRCDDECLRLRRLLDTWPADRPRAAILMLMHHRSMKHFERTAPLFDANFNAARRYPIIVFHEADLDDETERQKFRVAIGNNESSSLLFFQRVTFDMPPWINRSAVRNRVCFKTIGYRHMCRFQAKLVYDEPIMTGLRYVWRLDDDSYILKPIK